MPARLLVPLDRVADQPEHRRPQAHEERPPLGVASLVLIDRLGPDPEADAQPDRGQRQRVQVPAPQPTLRAAPDLASASTLPTARPRAPPTAPLPPPRHRRPLAVRHRPDLVALHVADDAAAPAGAGRVDGRDAPPPLPAGVSTEESQLADDGVGPLFHRRYRARIAEPEMPAEELMARVIGDPNQVAPTEFARFTKVARRGGADGGRRRVRRPHARPLERPGPGRRGRRRRRSGWPPSRATWRRARSSSGPSTTTAASWCSPSSPGPAAATGSPGSCTSALRMAKEVQLHMWTSFLERVAKLAGGRLAGGIDVETRIGRRRGRGRRAGRVARRPGSRRVLDELHDKALNFEPGDRDRFTPRTAGCPTTTASRCRPSRPGRPCRAGAGRWPRASCATTSSPTPRSSGPSTTPTARWRSGTCCSRSASTGCGSASACASAAWSTRPARSTGARSGSGGGTTGRSQGHLEMGQMDYEVWKWLDTGDVEFHICRLLPPGAGRQPGRPPRRAGLRPAPAGEVRPPRLRTHGPPDRRRPRRADDAEGTPRVADEVAVRPSASSG